MNKELIKRIKITKTIDEQYFKDLDVNSVADIWGICGQDLTKVNTNGLLTLEDKTFDTDTKFTEEDIKRLKPNDIIEAGKSKGLGVEKLHSIGVNGKGINVAIIDWSFNRDHIEFSNSEIIYDDELVKSKEQNNYDGFHGKTVASLMCGKNTGIAPNSKLLYFAVPEYSENHTQDRITTLKKIIEYNENNPKNKISVVSMSSSISIDENGQEKTHQIYYKKLEEQGCILIDAQIFNSKNFGIAERTNVNNPDDVESYDYSELYKLDDSAIDKTLKCKYKIFIQDERYKDWKYNEFESKYKEIFTKRMEEKKEKSVLIPSVRRTYAQVDTNEGYVYRCDSGSASFTIPILAGYVALCKQIDPELTFEKFYDAVQESKYTNSKGIKIVNPEGLTKIISINKEKRINCR